MTPSPLLSALVCLAALAGCSPGESRRPPAAPLERPERRADAPNPADAAQWLRRYAVHVLLVPLLDDEEPSRWAVRTDADPCLESGDATVDGQPVDSGTVLPAAFTVERRFDGCRVFTDARLALTGSVVLAVTSDATQGLRAVVDARRLAVRSLDGTEVAVGDVFVAGERAGGDTEEPARPADVGSEARGVVRARPDLGRSTHSVTDFRPPTPDPLNAGTTWRGPVD